MRIYQGKSQLEDAQAALEEVTQDWGAETPGIVLLFNSTKQDPQEVSRLFQEKFPESRIAGCTTAGEILDGHHYNGSLVAMALGSPKLDFQTISLNLEELQESGIEEKFTKAFDQWGVRRDDINPSSFFAMVFIDGLRMKEEKLAAILANSLAGIPVVGGSAGDDLKFAETYVYCDGKAATNHATVVLCRTALKYQVFKHQHFVNTDNAIVITKADPDKRIVYEIDGYPAAEAYARALGVEIAQLEGDVTFLHPVTFSSDGQIYVRSIQSVNEDGSIAFFCAIEEGMVLQVGGHHEMDSSLEETLSQLKKSYGKAELLFASNCILRSLEAQGGKKFEALGEVFREHVNHSIGFDTYGEQVNGLHVNQTLVGLALLPEEEVA